MLNLDRPTNSLTLEPAQGLIILRRSKHRHDFSFRATREGDGSECRHNPALRKDRGSCRRLRGRSPNRVYPKSAVERVLVVRRALRIGFTLAELVEVLKARDAGGAPRQRVYKLALEKLEGITSDIEALKKKERYLKQVLDDWESDPSVRTRTEVEPPSLAQRRR